jgi:hypothetical protein
MYKTISISDVSMRHSASEIAIESDAKEKNNQANEIFTPHTKIETSRQRTRHIISDAYTKENLNNAVCAKVQGTTIAITNTEKRAH